MRTFVTFGVSLLTVALLGACAERQTPATNPTPQQSVNSPKVQQSHDPFNGSQSSQAPLNDPTPQASTFPAPTSQDAFNDPKPEKPFSMTTESSHNKVLAKTERPLSDGEVLAVSMAANEGEVSVAEIAARKGQSADVKQFAGMMKTHHTTALNKDKALQAKAKITPADSDLSGFLKSDADATMKELRDQEGVAFDRAYMASQVKAHKDVLTALDNRLIPSATNGELKTALQGTRARVSDHLTRAEDIAKKLDASSSTSTSAPAAKPVKK